MIDIQLITQKFKEYTSKYNPNNGRIKLKIDHIKRVASNSKIIANSLKLTEEQTQLAIAIGFFHDIGRFEQVRIADTFSDKESGINHAEMSINVLFNNNLIREFMQDNKYDEVIKKAVLNHNKPSIESGLSDEELLFSKIIRDADKLDIFYTISDTQYDTDSIFWYSDFSIEKISDNILKDFYSEKSINYSLIQNNADQIATIYAYIYDLYFPFTQKIIIDNKYLEAFTERVVKSFSSLQIREQTYKLLSKSVNYLKKNI